MDIPPKIGSGGPILTLAKVEPQARGNHAMDFMDGRIQGRKDIMVTLDCAGVSNWAPNLIQNNRILIEFQWVANP
jgi:hypothetical protein